MSLKNLQVSNVRAIKQADLQLSPDLNLITGINGSGKTSLLEAIYLLGVGRSFRSHQIKNIINHETDKLTVYGKLASLNSDNLGILRDRAGQYKVRINQQDQTKLSSLARYLPVLVITPDSYRLLTSGPQHRRQFLDLSVFHVEHHFSSYWQRYNRILKQRNAQLKKTSSYSDLLIWDKEFAELANQLHIARKQEFLQLKTHLEDIQSTFLPQYRVQYRYYAGWESEAPDSFSEQLRGCYETDKRYGYTTLGAHKSDIKISVNNKPVQEVLSRGEQKMLVNAMHLAQAKRMSQDLNKNCLLLVDDLPSELDTNKQQQLMKELLAMDNIQLFVTAISEKDINLTSLNDDEMFTIKMFHVEQGDVSEVNN